MPTALGRRTYYASQYKNKSLFHDKSFSFHWPLIVSHDLGSCRNFYISHVYAIKVDDFHPALLGSGNTMWDSFPGKRQLWVLALVVPVSRLRDCSALLTTAWCLSVRYSQRVVNYDLGTPYRAKATVSGLGKVNLSKESMCLLTPRSSLQPLTTHLGHPPGLI